MGGKIINYDVVEMAGTDEYAMQKFKEEVNGKMLTGWQPFGGMTMQVSIVEPGGLLGKISDKQAMFSYSQAVVRYEEVWDSGEIDHPLQDDILDLKMRLENIEDLLSDIKNSD